jgi:hypothetical protein
LYELGVEIHLITARLDCKEMIEASKEEMKELGVKYHSLTLAPPYARKNMASVSQWKMLTRKSIAKLDTHNPIVLTVGDQWGDMVVLKTDDNIDEYNDNNSYRDSFMDLIYRCINIKKNKKYIENANNFIIVRNKYKFVWMIEAIMTGYIHNFMLVKLNASNSMLEYFDKFTSRDLI